MAEPDQERHRRIAKMRGGSLKRLFRCMSCCVTGRPSSLSFSSAWVLRLLQQRSVMKRILIAITGFVCVLALMICGVSVLSGFSTASEKKGLSASGSGREVTTRDHGASSGWTFSEGTGEYRGFVLDNVLRSSTQGNIHSTCTCPIRTTERSPMRCSSRFPAIKDCIFKEWESTCEQRNSDSWRKATTGT